MRSRFSEGFIKKSFWFRLLTLFLVAVTATADAATLDSYVYYNTKTRKAGGKDINQRLPIASVSKVMTTLWALRVRGKNYRYPTVVNINPIKDGLVDIHFTGSRDPLFGKENLHFIISELNKMGITSVRNLTYDENFKFFWDVRDGDIGRSAISTIEFPLNAPTATTVGNQLRANAPFLNGYSKTRREMKELKIDLVENPQFSVQNIAHLTSRTFTFLSFSYVKLRMRTFYSAPMHELLKEMNRNSNNHAANQIFQSLGGPNAFRTFMANWLKITEKDMRFVNGHGAPFWANGADGPLIINGAKIYNEATAKGVLATLAALDVVIRAQKLRWKDVLAVPGEHNSNTLDGAYGAQDLIGVLMAKTGTVDPSVTLAGLASTQTGPVLFYYNMATEFGLRRGAQYAQWSSARQQIRAKVIEMITKEFGGGKPVQIEDYDANTYNLRTGPTLSPSTLLHRVPPLLSPTLRFR